MDCWQTGISTLDVSELKHLTSLSCGGCEQLKELVVKGADALEALTCSEARLTRLDISGLTKLWYLNCAGNSLLVTLNLQGAESLYELWAGGTSLKVLDISGNSKLRKLVVSPNKDLKEIRVFWEDEASRPINSPYEIPEGVEIVYL